MPDKLDLTALLGTRICHDLISPIGAIGNGVELLMLGGSTTGPEIALISESVANASARIRFFRVAFGAATQDQRVGRPEVLSILSDITKGGRLSINWQVSGDLPRREVKLAFLLIQCLETAMPFGGTITVERTENRWSMTGQSAKIRIEPNLWEVLSNPGAAVEISAAHVHFGLIPEVLHRLERRLTVQTTETQVAISF